VLQNVLHQNLHWQGKVSSGSFAVVVPGGIAADALLCIINSLHLGLLKL